MFFPILTENAVKKKQLFKLKATLKSENNNEDIYMDNNATSELENVCKVVPYLDNYCISDYLYLNYS